MSTSPRGLLLAATLLMASGVPVVAQRPATPPPLTQPTPRPFAWWKSEPFEKEIGLTADQAARIDKIWETTRTDLRQEWDELSKLDDKLSRLIQNDADEAVLARQIDRVEMARANANKTRALMLVQMRKVLTPDQRLRLDTIHERWLKETQPQPTITTPETRRKKPDL